MSADTLVRVATGQGYVSMYAYGLHENHDHHWVGGGVHPKGSGCKKFTARLRRSASEPKVKHVLLTDTSLHFYITLVGFLTHWTRTRHRFCNRWVTPESQIQAKWLRCLLMVINRGRGPLRVLPLVHLSNWHIINKHLNCCHDPIPTPTAASRPPLFSKKGPPPTHIDVWRHLDVFTGRLQFVSLKQTKCRLFQWNISSSVCWSTFKDKCEYDGDASLRTNQNLWGQTVQAQ